jgi:hypothetical protein
MLQPRCGASPAPADIGNAASAEAGGIATLAVVRRYGPGATE